MTPELGEILKDAYMMGYGTRALAFISLLVAAIALYVALRALGKTARK